MTTLKLKTNDLPPVRGRYTEDAPLGAGGWFRCGGSADVLFKPADRDDLIEFLSGLSPDIPVQVFGALSNCIIRDGGVRGVTIRLGRDFSEIKTEGDLVHTGALALDANVAQVAAEAGIGGLEFFSGIPGTIGGALRMNAGCYGTETKDVLVECEALDRAGNLHVLRPCHLDPGLDPGERSHTTDGDPSSQAPRDDEVGEEMNMTYRHTDVPEDYIFLSATFKGVPENSDEVLARMAEIKHRREQSQPIREKTGGSTFANPSAEQLSQSGLSPDTKVWQLIDQAGGRGLKIGGAMMSEKHCNFMINTGDASAADLEALGEEIKARVLEKSGIALRWEIKRIGEKAS